MTVKILLEVQFTLLTAFGRKDKILLHTQFQLLRPNTINRIFSGVNYENRYNICTQELVKFY